VAFYELNALPYLGVAMTWSLRLYDATSMQTMAEWLYFLQYDGNECKIPRVLTLFGAYYYNELDVCCKNAPTYVTITPL
jgi:hypothetical protein